MNCRRFDDRLQDLLDNRVAPESDVQLNQHASQCKHCRQALDIQTELFRHLPRRTANQTTHILASRYNFSSLAVAAGLMLAMALGVRQFGSGRLPSTESDRLAGFSRSDGDDVDSAAKVHLAAGRHEMDWKLVANWAQSVELPSERPEWISRVACEFQPVADSVQSAFSVLRRSTLPGRQSPKKPAPQAAIQPYKSANV